MEDYKKKYEQAMERMKSLAKGEHPECFTEANKAAEFVFPELKETGGGNIRKEIIDYLKSFVPHHDGDLVAKSKVWIAWLEKQDVKKPTRPIWKYKKDHTPLLRDSFILNKYGCVGKSPSGALVSDVWVLDFDELAKLPKEEFERQSEQPEELPNGEDYGIDSLYHAVRILEKTLGEVEGYQSDDGILEHKCAIEAVKRLYEQKPDWSEEDEKISNAIWEAIDFLCLESSGVSENELCDWLKSLKERCVFQSHWKPSENQIK